MLNNSKEHEVKVLNSVFKDSSSFFDDLGYKGYVFESRDGEGVPDGYFKKGTSLIWVEHTQARMNYGEKGSLLPGFDGFCKDVQHELLKEGKKGCVCFDIPFSVAERYLVASEYKSEVLDITRHVIDSSKEYEDNDQSVYIKYCSLEDCCLKNLDNYKGLRVTVCGWHNVEFCQLIPLSVYDNCVSNKEKKFQSNPKPRKENWLFIEVPWRYSFGSTLPETSKYFDKIFTVECRGKDGIECFIPKLSAKRISFCKKILKGIAQFYRRIFA